MELFQTFGLFGIIRGHPLEVYFRIFEVKVATYIKIKN